MTWSNLIDLTDQFATWSTRSEAKWNLVWIFFKKIELKSFKLFRNFFLNDTILNRLGQFGLTHSTHSLSRVTRWSKFYNYSFFILESYCSHVNHILTYAIVFFLCQSFKKKNCTPIFFFCFLFGVRNNKSQLHLLQYRITIINLL
jgi:hypothetical protein